MDGKRCQGQFRAAGGGVKLSLTPLFHTLSSLFSDLSAASPGAGVRGLNWPHPLFCRMLPEGAGIAATSLRFCQNSGNDP